MIGRMSIDPANCAEMAAGGTHNAEEDEHGGLRCTACTFRRPPPAPPLEGCDEHGICVTCDEDIAGGIPHLPGCPALDTPG